MPIAPDPVHPTIPPPSGLPHQSPFRLLDRLLHVDLDRGDLWAERRLTADDALWPGESAIWDLSDRDRPITLPALLLIEALSQAAACFNLLAAAATARTSDVGTQRPQGGESDRGTHLGFLVSVTDFRFPDDPRDGATPGDTLLLHVTRQESLGALTAFSGRAFCLPPVAPGGGEVADAQPGSGRSPSEGSRFSPPKTARVVGHGRLLFAVTSK